MNNNDGNKKVYSPDIDTYNFEGTEGLMSTLSSIIVGPLRLLMRVMHTIFILPSNLMISYVNGLFVANGALFALGLLSLLLLGKWSILISQIPVTILAFYLKSRANAAMDKTLTKKEVDINSSAIEELCDTIYDELDKTIKLEEGNHEQDN